MVIPSVARTVQEEALIVASRPPPARPVQLASRRAQSGKVGWALLWLLGIPLPVLLIAYLIFHH